MEPLPAGLRKPPGPPRPPAPPTTGWSGPGPHGEGFPRRGSIAGERGFFTGVAAELRKVAWPTRESTLWNAALVLAVVVAVASLLVGLDTAFAKLASSLIR